MRSASSKKLATLGLLTLLSGSGAFAAPTISGWSIKQDGNQEIINVRWSEPAAIETEPFVGARQITVVVPGATLERGADTLKLEKNSLLLKGARLQEVTQKNGDKAVQVTLRLREDASYKTEKTADGFVIRMDVPKTLIDAVPAAPAVGKGYQFTDAKVKELDARSFGSVSAPSTGAGQAPSNDAVSKYYVPPRTGGDTAAAGSGGMDSSDMNQLAVQTKLNERVERVDFQGTSLENVLRLIAEEAELNILIKPSDVQGKNATLRLRDVTLRQMLDSILKANDLGYTVEPGGIINIVPRDLVRSTEKEVVLETIAINWVDAAGVAATLKPFIDAQDGKIEVSSTGNMIIVRDVPETVRRIQDLVSQIDVPEKQVMMELRLVNLSETARRAFGTRTDWASTDTQTHRIFNEDGSQAITDLTNSSNNGSNNTNTSSQSATGSVFQQSANSSSSNTSTNSNSSTTDASEGIFPTSLGGAGLLAPGASAFSIAQKTTWSVLGTDFDVNFQLNAQEERGEAATLANPTVLALNNVEARVEIQSKIPYLTAINTDQGSIGTVEFKDIGTEVILLPHITPNGFVQMHIAPEQIIDTGLRPAGVPQTDERRIEASVIVKDEQTIALGGLRQFETSSAENGVPYLLRLPVLSWLFKNQSNGQNKTELYLFVTPHIVKDPTPTSYQQALYEKIDYNWDLPDYYFDEVMARSAPGEEFDDNAKKR